MEGRFVSGLGPKGEEHTEKKHGTEYEKTQRETNRDSSSHELNEVHPTVYIIEMGRDRKVSSEIERTTR